MIKYFEKLTRGTDQEDTLVILQFLRTMIGHKFLFLNYYKEIPVSYHATLLSVEKEMAEFSVHEYQAKVISLEKKTLIYGQMAHDIPEAVYAEAFYVSTSKKRVVLRNFSYAQIYSNMRRYVRVFLDHPVECVLTYEGGSQRGHVKDISLGGAALNVSTSENLAPGMEVEISLRLPESFASPVSEVVVGGTIINVIGTTAPFTCVIEFNSEKQSQQQIAYFINQRQVEIIKELKDVNA